jgi:hypothetical protein
MPESAALAAFQAAEEARDEAQRPMLLTLPHTAEAVQTDEECAAEQAAAELSEDLDHVHGALAGALKAVEGLGVWEDLYMALDNRSGSIWSEAAEIFDEVYGLHEQAFGLPAELKALLAKVELTQRAVELLQGREDKDHRPTIMAIAEELKEPLKERASHILAESREDAA